MLQRNLIDPVFVVILCVITLIRCDVSHVVLGGESPVDAGTIEILKQNISNYLTELEHGGNPQMQLKQIYSASKQIVTGTLYTVHALLETPQGAKNCEIRVLEKPWLDFCHVRVNCEHGGQYEVTLNPSQIQHDVSQLSLIDILPSALSPAKSAVSIHTQNPFVSQFQSTQFQKQETNVPFSLDIHQHLTAPNLPISHLPVQNIPVPYTPVQNVPNKHVTVSNVPTSYSSVQNIHVPHFPVQNVPNQQHVTTPNVPVQNVHIPHVPTPTIQPDIPPLFDVRSPPLPSFTPQHQTIVPSKIEINPLPTPAVQHQVIPQPHFNFKLQTTPVFTTPNQVQYDHAIAHDHHELPIESSFSGIPKPIFPPPPELNVLPFDQVPQGSEFVTYLEGLFKDFMIKYNRHYIDEPNELAYRFNVFTDNFHTMHEHSKADRLACQYSVTEFSDLTKNEFERILGFDTSVLNSTDIENADIPSTESQGRSIGGTADDIPEKYDQRDENIVTRVKFQGDCGACWAFVTTAVVEGLCAKRTKKLQEFSEQSLIDCDNSNYGCKGGVPPNAFKHIAKRGGLELESIYPYVFEKSNTCKFDAKTVRVKVSGVVGFRKNDEEGMAKWLFKNGPILVGINADPLQFYKSGVLNPTPLLCSPKKINHGVTLIGYGVEVNTSTGERLPYWIAKNQWGTRFGEDGFFRIARGKNSCGLALWANSAKLANITNNCLLEGA